MGSSGTHRGPLKSRHEVEDNREKHRDEDGDGNVDESMGGGFDEGVVHGSLLVPSEDGALGVQSGDLSHARERGEEHGAVNAS